MYIKNLKRSLFVLPAILAFNANAMQQEVDMIPDALQVAAVNDAQQEMLNRARCLQVDLPMLEKDYESPVRCKVQFLGGTRKVEKQFVQLCTTTTTTVQTKLKQDVHRTGKYKETTYAAEKLGRPECDGEWQEVNNCQQDGVIEQVMHTPVQSDGCTLVDKKRTVVDHKNGVTCTVTDVVVQVQEKAWETVTNEVIAGEEAEEQGCAKQSGHSRKSSRFNGQAQEVDCDQAFDDQQEARM